MVEREIQEGDGNSAVANGTENEPRLIGDIAAAIVDGIGDGLANAEAASPVSCPVSAFTGIRIKGTASDARLPTGSLTVSGEAHAAMPCRACAITGERCEASSNPLLCSSAFIANSGGHSVDCCNCDNLPLVTPNPQANSVSDGEAGSAR